MSTRGKWEVTADLTTFGRAHILQILYDGRLVTGFALSRYDPGHIQPLSIDFSVGGSFPDEQMPEQSVERVDEGTNFLQAVLDCAWQQGLRPTGFHDTTESMAATKWHLEDMRRLVFATVPAVKPEDRS